MKSADIAIVGAGLAGLYAAWLLERLGTRDYVVIEARDVPGGRIASFKAEAVPGARFDLGPTWFWPAYQSELDGLVAHLGLARFPQHERGDTLVERSAIGPPMRVRGYVDTPPSMRLEGGMEALVEALRTRIDASKIVTGQAVRRLHRAGDAVEVESEDGAGRVTAWRARHVLLALPPRLAAAIAFTPELPRLLAGQWHDTATWMASHAKYVAVYEEPFWRDAGLSGEARSARGPLAEIHDASTPGAAALFGFFGVPATVRGKVPDDVLRAHCRAQLARLFGPQAGVPVADVIKDWAHDPSTATAADLDAAGQHAEPPPAAVADGLWQGCLTGIASEWSPRFPGYVAGAIEAAGLAVSGLAGAPAIPFFP